ncbi:Lipoate-protein ligase A [Kiritimatiella glycovorans]|uniref:Lipoate-protein ligase A n=2 Tax=Kiritimatiella glycovorans TaxID=1307763 RepID=A0A0G3EFF6_9BACT|nr:Lipoate-protein ligase A [Kiritimatiella glycovorans]
MVYHSPQADVWRNLALEAHLLDRADLDRPLLLTWAGCEAVVLGRNQNPWRECDPEALSAAGVPLARRVSGGGTVYHDPGNLNYGVITDRTRYEPERVYAVAERALAGFGVRLERVEKTRLYVRGRKCSGHAFAFRRGRALHHGTLLVEADLERLERMLTPALPALETAAVPSVRAPVANLAEFAPGLDIPSLRDALERAFIELFGSGPRLRLSLNDAEEEDLTLREAQLRAPEWLYGRTPPFSADLPGGRRVRVRRGRLDDGRGDWFRPEIPEP